MKARFESEKRTDKIEIRIEPTLKELLGDRAFEEGVTVSDYVRELIQKDLRKKRKRS